MTSRPVARTPAAGPAALAPSRMPEPVKPKAAARPRALPSSIRSAARSRQQAKPPPAIRNRKKHAAGSPSPSPPSGIEAQREAVARLSNGGDWTQIAELVETKSGKNADRRRSRRHWPAFRGCKPKPAEFLEPNKINLLLSPTTRKSR